MIIQQLQNAFNETLDALYALPEDYLQLLHRRWMVIVRSILIRASPAYSRREHGPWMLLEFCAAARVASLAGCQTVPRRHQVQAARVVAGALRINLPDDDDRHVGFHFVGPPGCLSTASRKFRVLYEMHVILSLRRIRTLRVATRDPSFLRMTVRVYRTRNFRNSPLRRKSRAELATATDRPHRNQAAGPVSGESRHVDAGSPMGAGVASPCFTCNWMCRGLACSAFGMRSVSNPFWYSASTLAESIPAPSRIERRNVAGPNSCHTTLAPSGTSKRNSPSIASVSSCTVTLMLCWSRPGARKVASYPSPVSQTLTGSDWKPVLPPLAASLVPLAKYGARASRNRRSTAVLCGRVRD